MGWIYTELSAEKLGFAKQVRGLGTRGSSVSIPMTLEQPKLDKIGITGAFVGYPGPGFTASGVAAPKSLDKNPNIVPVTNSFDARLSARSAR
jgi:hypothetical protein